MVGMGKITKKLSKTTLDAAAQDKTRRPRQEARRKETQDARRPDDPEERKALEEAFNEDDQKQQWVSRPPWYKKGKHQQGISLYFADPEPLRGTSVAVVDRKKNKYSVILGFSSQTSFDPQKGKVGVQCSTVSGKHAQLNFERKKKGGPSTVSIQDLNSLNGTFVLARPPKASKSRPMLEKEIKEKERAFDLKDVEYIRLGSACVLVPDHTNIYCQDAEESDSDDEDDIDACGDDEDLLDEMLKQVDHEDNSKLGGGLGHNWYYPAPCHERVREITQRKRASPRGEKKSKSNKKATI